MGCLSSKRSSNVVDEGRKTSENGLKNSAYAASEFDLPTSDSDDEILSISSINENKDKRNLTKKNIDFANGLTTAKVNASTTSSTLLGNRISETPI